MHVELAAGGKRGLLEARAPGETGSSPEWPRWTGSHGYSVSRSEPARLTDRCWRVVCSPIRCGACLYRRPRRSTRGATGRRDALDTTERSTGSGPITSTNPRRRLTKSAPSHRGTSRRLASSRRPPAGPVSLRRTRGTCEVPRRRPGSGLPTGWSAPSSSEAVCIGARKYLIQPRVFRRGRSRTRRRTRGAPCPARDVVDAMKVSHQSARDRNSATLRVSPYRLGSIDCATCFTPKELSRPGHRRNRARAGAGASASAARGIRGSSRMLWAGLPSLRDRGS